ncbi:MAG TPA: regulatory protein RecX [Flavobacterium sp.]|nr:regulatory protein RecX [Flavobacterium sp.]
MTKTFTPSEIKQKIEYFCSYQERCHDEVIQKMRSMAIDFDTIDEIVVHLIENNYLNEERFACSFARGKHRIKNWGRTRIINELKSRNISQYIINAALKEIDGEEYLATFETLAQRRWETLTEKNILKKGKKFCDFLLRKGFESNLVYQKMKDLSN